MVEAANGISPVVVITGASAGLGRAVARAFAAEGAHIGLIARGRDGLEGARREVEELGGRAVAIPCDVADERRVHAAADLVEDELGPIDVWVNNAMVTVFSPIKRTTGEEFKRVTEVNYLGYVHGTMAALDRMLPRDRGTIVQVSSALGFRSIPLQAAYCASKRAIIGFTESLRTELFHDGSRVNVTMVHMPALNTPQFGWSRSRMPRRAQPVPPIFEPELGAEAVVHAARDGQRRDWAVTGSALKAILGNKVAPGLLDRYLARVAYDRQMTDEAEDPNRPDNLFGPVAGDHGAHGRFDEPAKARSIQLWLNERRAPLGLAAVGLLAMGAWLTLLARSR